VRTNARAKVLKELVRESQYVVDPSAVADAIIARSLVRLIVPQVSLRSSSPGIPPARSFRRHRGGRSFRLSRPERRPRHRGGGQGSPHLR
jgi:hypothetical protein